MKSLNRLIAIAISDLAIGIWESLMVWKSLSDQRFCFESLGDYNRLAISGLIAIAIV